MKSTVLLNVLKATLSFFIMLFLVTGAAWYFQEAANRSIETIYVIIALTPFLFYLFLSDKLEHFKGGGFELTLRSEMSKEVDTFQEDETIEYTEERPSEKTGISALYDMMESQQPTTLSFTVGLNGYYSQQAIETYIDELSHLPSFRYVLLKDAENRFKGYMYVEDFQELLHSDENIVSLIESADILRSGEVIRESVSSDATNKQVLQKMDTLNLTEVAVLDQKQQFLGTITQDEIVRKILTKVIREV